MSDWLAQYTAALEARDAREQAHKQYIDAYTRLANKSAASVAQLQASPQIQQQSTTPGASTPTRSKGTAREATSSPVDTNLATLRTDLASTQKARATLAATLKDVEVQLSQLRLERKDAAAQIAVLTRTKVEAERKLKDRDEELRGKASLVEQAQDEMVSLGLQLNMAEEKTERLTRENKELVDRWMKRMAEEAEKVNRDSKWS